MLLRCSPERQIRKCSRHITHHKELIQKSTCAFWNETATRLLVNCEDLSVPPDGIKRHKRVEVQLEVGLQKEFARVLPKPQSNMAQEDLDEMAQTKVEEKR